MRRSVFAIFVGWIGTALFVSLVNLIVSYLFFGTAQAPTIDLETVTSTYLATSFIGGLLASASGGYLTARLASKAGLAHALILALIHLLLAIPVIWFGPGASAGQPAWYPIFTAIPGIGGAIVGGLVWHYLLRGE